LRLINPGQAVPADRAHFIGLAARAMRSILVDHARSRGAVRRGGDRARLPLDDAVALFESRSTDLLALDEALEELAKHDERQTRIVEMRFFGGMTTAELADVLGISTRTVEREWRMARAWLRRQICVEPPDDG
jgi:RNA polymerase sigma factor (TIGR02999 family)